MKSRLGRCQMMLKKNTPENNFLFSPKPTTILDKFQMASQGTPIETKAEDEELDDWDQRIFSTGCAEEQLRMNDCYYDKKDWRACKNEMEAFRQCWKRKGNEERTQSKDT
ncbi:hypothetical protein EDD36DRAFT_427699 [Exophiala viscosa]|uniref:CHCH domain-containing protein n=1 Tax=Exophiala viscosa TaxID=2486360 RepID=A0AAN6IIU0_9EURO|nr:hypothetical protein EDD36DRAFT_427699 [Exophiala viscosa]